MTLDSSISGAQVPENQLTINFSLINYTVESNRPPKLKKSRQKKPKPPYDCSRAASIYFSTQKVSYIVYIFRYSACFNRYAEGVVLECC